MAGNPWRVLLSERMIGGVLTLLFLIGYLGDWKILRTLEYLTYDLRAPLRANPHPSDQIVIVGVDDDSLAPIGRRPWPRSVIKQLIETVRDGGAAVIGVGFLLTEPDQAQGLEALRGIHDRVAAEAAVLEQAEATPKTRDADRRLQEAYRTFLQYLRDAEARLDQDAKLAEALANSPQVVLPMFFEIGTPLTQAVEEPSGPILANAVGEITNPADLKRYPLIETWKLTSPLPALLREGIALGHINIRPDEDGVVRKELLLLKHGTHFYPSFALRAASAYFKVRPQEIRVTLGQHVTTGPIEIPTDPLMRLRMSFNGPAGTFQTVSARDVLAGKIPPQMFRGKLVLLGPLATGIADRNATPVASSLPGVEVAATAIQNIMDQNFISVPSWAAAVERGMVVVVGVFLVAALPRLRALPAGLVALTLLIGYVGAAAFLFAADGYVIAVLDPSLLLTTGYLLITSKRFLMIDPREQVGGSGKTTGRSGSKTAREPRAVN